MLVWLNIDKMANIHITDVGLTLYLCMVVPTNTQRTLALN